MPNFQVPKLKEFADDISKCDDTEKWFSDRAENIMGKGEFAHHEQFLLFPQFFLSCLQETG